MHHGADLLQKDRPPPVKLLDHGVKGVGKVPHKVYALAVISHGHLLCLPRQVPEKGMKRFQGRGQLIVGRGQLHIQISLGNGLGKPGVVCQASAKGNQTVSKLPQFLRQLSHV
ncbi:hypothetical protein SDC9_94271 [bioreactor metagenome]|uniref:Uncharacterized protein n=1 Tax=bioreactor metagenome TaxID=1076179 RepID=A0A645A2Z2_9ZZZZ